jgi:ribosomal protein S18 acetylase RimI-like enzyme
LDSAIAADVDSIMSWFPDAESTLQWGGENFRYPFTRESFHDDCRWTDMATYVLRNGNGRTAGFAQFYVRNECTHFARICVNPDLRGRGYGKIMLDLLMEEGRRVLPYEKFSLFVMRDNAAARSLYEKLGFQIDDYPPNASMKDICFYMTKSAKSD